MLQNLPNTMKPFSVTTAVTFTRSGSVRIFYHTVVLRRSWDLKKQGWRMILCVVVLQWFCCFLHLILYSTNWKSPAGNSRKKLLKCNQENTTLSLSESSSFLCVQVKPELVFEVWHGAPVIFDMFADYFLDSLFDGQKILEDKSFKCAQHIFTFLSLAARCAISHPAYLYLSIICWWKFHVQLSVAYLSIYNYGDHPDLIKWHLKDSTEVWIGTIEKQHN